MKIPTFDNAELVGPETTEETLAAALAPFGWTCGPEFWERYYADPWVFHLANAVERLTGQIAKERAYGMAWVDCYQNGGPTPMRKDYR